MRNNTILVTLLTVTALVGCDGGDGEDGSTTTPTPMTEAMTEPDPTTPTTTEPDPGTGTGSGALSFETDIYPAVIMPSCSCHVTGSGGLVMGGDAAAAYASMVGKPSSITMPYVTASDSTMSYMWHKINGTQADVGGTGSQMPQVGGPLSADQIALVAEWIDAGAAP